MGYARTDLSDQALRDKLRPFLKNTPEDKREAFLATCSYVSGPYDTPHGWQRLAAVLDKRESATPKNPAGRLFYLALPPSVYPQVCRGLKEHCSSIATSSEPGRSWVRVVVEKPFGKDLQSSEDLAEHLGELYPEEQLYRIDHYLGKVRPCPKAVCSLVLLKGLGPDGECRPYGLFLEPLIGPSPASMVHCTCRR